MKKYFLIKKIAALTLMFCFILANAVLAASAPLSDEAGLLSAADANSINQKLMDFNQKHDVTLAIVTKKSLGGQKINDAADSYVNGVYANKNGTMLLIIAMDTRDWRTVRNHTMHEKIDSKNFGQEMDSLVVPKLSGGDYASAFNGYIDTMDELLTYYEQNGKPYNPADNFSVLALVLAMILAVLGAIFVRSTLIAQMSNVMPASGAGEYLRKDSFNLKSTSDTFLYMNVARMPKPKKKSGSVTRTGGGNFSSGGKF